MALFRNAKEFLFGKSVDPNSLGRNAGHPTSAMINAKMAQSEFDNNTLGMDPTDNFGSLDPLQFTHVQYPHDLTSMTNGHYIKFDIYQNMIGNISQKPSYGSRFSNTGIEAPNIKGTEGLIDIAKNIFRATRSPAEKALGDKGNHISNDTEGGADGALSRLEREYQNAKNPIPKNDTPEAVNMDLHSHTHETQSSASILLYTPTTNKFRTEANYENAETGFLAEFIGDDNLASMIASVGSKVGGAAIVAALEVVVPGAGGFFNRSTGMAVNPNMELAFKSVPFRSFNFEYKFAPKNKMELANVHKIIQLFRYHMSPALIGKTQYFAAPSQFVLTYCYKEKDNNYIPKIAKCVLENVEVDYSPGEKFTTLRPDAVGASPQVITMNMQFKEMSIITKDSIAKGF
tara:strand:+ start:2323 stop:3528 length:1206 start_codon:yes stop_codon:yes gene_type:complete